VRTVDIDEGWYGDRDISILAGRWAWLVLAVGALAIYISVGTGREPPPEWMAAVIPLVPFGFIGVGVGIGVRRKVREDPQRDRGR
jgi:hypothetical protein